MDKKTSQQSYYNRTQLLAPRALVAMAERETKQIPCSVISRTRQIFYQHQDIAIVFNGSRGRQNNGPLEIFFHVPIPRPVNVSVHEKGTLQTLHVKGLEMERFS